LQEYYKTIKHRVSSVICQRVSALSEMYFNLAAFYCVLINTFNALDNETNLSSHTNELL